MLDNYTIFQLNFDDYFDKSLKAKEEVKNRKDYCYDCNTDELYVHVMTFKCSKCHKIIIG